MACSSHRLNLAAAVGFGCCALQFQSVKAKTYTARDGSAITLPDDQNVLGRPAISPDGSHVAYIRAAGRPAGEDDPQPSEVLLANAKGGNAKVLVHSGASSEWYSRPIIGVTFAADGKHLFAERTYPGDSHSIHEIDLKTGQEKFLTWGVDLSVLRNGPWRGDLLIGMHTCYSSRTGCDYPVHVVTSAGKSVYVVPGTAGLDDGQHQAWLVKRHWHAW